VKYPVYQKRHPSGVEWLGDIPEEWDVRRIATMATKITNGFVGPTRDILVNDGVRYLQSLHIKENKIAFHKEYFVEPEWSAAHSKSILKEGDVVVVQTGDIGQVACVPKEFEGCNCHALIIISPRGRELCGRFLAHYLNSTVGFDELKRIETGALHPHLNCGLVRDVRFPFPSLAEQSSIADFLDAETAKLDTLMTKKRELIGKLREKRSVLISRTVTRGLPPETARAAGLNPNPKLKLSGIEWLGEVPEHWEFGNIRRFAQMRTGHTRSRSEPAYWEDCNIPWFTLADVWQLRDGRQTYLGETKEKLSRVGLLNSAAELLPAGTVVFSRTASIGFSGVMPIPMATSQDFWNWVPGKKLIPEYLMFLFRAMRQEFDRLTMGSTHKTIYQPEAAGLSICVPPRLEQRAIIDYLDRETIKIDGMVAKVEEAIERLQEYRTALITAAVTGKIDVRDTNAPRRQCE
jgi:type I restriction enzyme S subunit